MPSVKDLFKIAIQFRCLLPQSCSISSVLNFEVKSEGDLGLLQHPRWSTSR